MCGIFGIFDANLSTAEIRKLALKCSKLIRHRGPDWSGVDVYFNKDANNNDDPSLTQIAALAHERLAIVNPSSGTQVSFVTQLLGLFLKVQHSYL